MLGHAAALFERIANIWRRGGNPRCRDLEQLAGLLAGEAAFVAQKSTIEYCRARAGCNWDKLFAGDEFAREMKRARWMTFPLVLADLAEMLQILLRRGGFEAAASADRLRPVVARALRWHGPPEIPLDLEQAEAAIAARLERTLAAPIRPVYSFAPATGRAVFDALPLKTDARGDRTVVENQVVFLLCGAYGRLEERIALAEIARALIAPARAVVGPAGFEPATRPL